MSLDLIFLVVFLLNFVASEKWIKLPDIKPGIIKEIKKQEPQMVVFKLAPPPSILSSDIMSSVFSTNPSATTNSPIITAGYSSTQRSYTKKYFQSTVTSKVLTFPSNVSQLIDDEEFEPIPFVMVKPIKVEKIKFFNQTMAMNVLPIDGTIDRIDNEKSSEEKEEDDGVTITDDIDDSLEYYDDDYEEEESTTSSTTTTTQSPKKEHKAPKNNPQKNPQRRIIAVRANPNLSFSSFIKFIKTIQESLAIKTAKTITEKIKMLMEFRDSLMMAINRKIKRLWRMQPKVTATTTARKFRTKRTLGDGLMDKGGAMDFPSAEGALLSICFLTFAVFLIKLVLQVIHTIKMKKAMWAAQMMTNNAENVVIKRHRSGRDVDEKYRNLAKILDSIENLKV